MKAYTVTITETLRMEVEVEAENRSEAEDIVRRNWKNAEYILDAESFSGVDFRAESAVKSRDYER